MSNELKHLQDVWDSTQKRAVENTHFPLPKFEDITSKIISLGPFYYYIIDFFDMSVSHVSEQIREIHGLNPDETTFQDILGTIHPEDVPYVQNTERAIAEFYYSRLRPEQLLKYKMNYSFRSKMADGNYALLNHQAILLTLDTNGGFGKSLNIHTRIDHITAVNNLKFSLIGLDNEPSFMNMSLKENMPLELSKREIEIVKLLGEGMDSSQIGEKLFISPKTVKKHRSNILNKLNVKNTSQAVKEAMVAGLI
ncbi:LuxR C-terminal-related transcriptional regulator [Fluviicola sp.]|uniref:LuxR C-terminal-related transcriptional regulator n=1 Tax=Fluviicola sp. TaxID=1917219 RepID=UPI0031D7C588